MHEVAEWSAVRRTRRPVVVVVGAVLALLLAVSTACAPTDPAADPFGLYAELGTGSFALHWRADPTATAGYDLQVMRGVDPLWHDLPPAAGTSTVVGSLVDGVTYQFRVRVASPAGGWSAPIAATYVEPVLPVVRIDTTDRAPIVGTEVYVPGSFSIDPNGASVSAYHGTMQVKGRGNSTAAQPKRPFKIKLDTKSALMGMPSEKDWVLLANYFDRSSLRNFASTQLGRATGLAWTPDSRFVEVVLNGAYQGVYQLAEQVEVSGRRVAVDEMDEHDLTGGYLLEIDDRLETAQEPGFRTTRGLPVVIKDPDPAEPAQAAYIRDYVQSFEDALYSPGFADPVTGYRAYLDVDTFIDWYLVEELLANKDAMWSSSFMYKPADGRLAFGPLWDFDVSMGSEAFGASPARDQWWVRRAELPLVTRLFADPTFVQRLVERWDAHRAEFDQVPDAVEAQGVALHDALRNDAAAWGYTVAPNDTPEYLRSWLADRLVWLDGQLHQLTA